MTGREFPESLTSVLSQAREFEATARGTHRERAMIAATSALLLAAFDAGWQQLELAACLGMKLPTVHKRIQTARQAHPYGVGIVVDRPLDCPPSRLGVLQQPIDERSWLTISEAAVYASRNTMTLRNWLARGVLPNTDNRSSGVHLYFKPDLDRVLQGPTRGQRAGYPDFDQLLKLIAASPV